jgi:nucleotide-binding universal stress UspA family protein
MSELNPTPIVVAVRDDSIDAALVLAAAEAAEIGCGLHLVHVVHLFVQGSDGMVVESTDQERLGRQSLNAALERVRELAEGGTVITADLVLGRVVPSLVDAARDARMIVLEHRDRPRLQRVVTRSVASGVAARARVPVVSVPSGWSAGTPTEPHGVVTVGVDDPDRSEQVLRTACEATKRRGANLRIVHTWSFPSAYDDIVMTREENAEWTARAKREIQSVLDGLGETAEVPVDIEVGHARPADALVHASQSSDLLVVGRHDPKIPLGSHLGPVARAVLHASACPVLLADPVK